MLSRGGALLALPLALACRSDDGADRTDRLDPPSTGASGTTGDTATTTTSTASTRSTGDTGNEATLGTGDTGCACDDGLDCTEDACDALGRCVATPLYDCAWPASPIEYAVPLAVIDPELEVSVSGASWNASTRRLWVVRNSGPEGVFRLAEDGLGGWLVDVDASGEAAEWIDLELGDLEGITQTDPEGAPDVVTVIDEEIAHVVSYDLSVAGVAVEVGRWDVSPWCPSKDRLGPEAVVFVPDALLADWGFVDADGQPRTSTLGLGGLVLVGWQRGGEVFAFDLSATDGTVAWVGTYETGRGETSGLELDWDTGRLYLWHGGQVNDLEVARLSSTDAGLPNRVLDAEAMFDFVGEGNLEGVALAGLEDCGPLGRPLWLVVDGGVERSISLFPDWPVGCP